jgi:hypothetical protein
MQILSDENISKKQQVLTLAIHVLLVLFFAGLLWSRALLSITHGMIMLVAAIVYKQWWHAKSGRLLIWSFTPVMLFALGAWQLQNVQAWDYLLSLSVYPAAVLGITLAQHFVSINTVARYWIVTALVSLINPIYHLLTLKTSLYGIYSSAGTLPVWMDGDHVRYGLFLCGALGLLLFSKSFSGTSKFVAGILLLAAIVLLSIRTAWVGAFLIALFYLIKDIADNNRRRLSIFLLLLIPVLAFAAYSFIPSVKGKIDYMIYDWQNYSRDKLDVNYSDGARWGVNKTAWQLIRSGNTNIGWGNVPNTLQQKVREVYPQSQSTYGLPFNQWLYWWLGGGWWTAVLFTCWLFFPSVVNLRSRNFYPVAVYTLLIAASCLIESTLVFQFGIVLHAWLIAISWKREEFAD